MLAPASSPCRQLPSASQQEQCQAQCAEAGMQLHQLARRMLPLRLLLLLPLLLLLLLLLPLCLRTSVQLRQQQVPCSGTAWSTLPTSLDCSSHMW
jgi:hypothetical protein